MFQIKNLVSIAASMANHMRATQKKITDFNIGSIARTLVEACAIEIDELYQQMFSGLKEGIPVATYNSFDFARLTAQAATGLIRVTITSQPASVIIPAGTVFKLSGSAITYASAVDVIIAASNTFGDALVTASAPGSAGNLQAATAFTMTPTPTGFLSASNQAAFSNGTDDEIDADRKVRFNAFIASLPRGTVAAIAFGIKNFAFLTNSAGAVSERVATVSIVEPWLLDSLQPISLVNVFIHNGVGSTSSDLVNKTNDVVYGYYDTNGNPVPGWKAAGVKVTIAAAIESLVNIAGTVTAKPGFDQPTLAVAAAAAIRTLLLGLGIGETFEVADMYFDVKSIDGVDNFVPANLAPPAVPVLGSVASGALGSATYFVKTTYVNSKGETLASSEVSLAVAASHVLTVASPASYVGATGWNVYVSTTTGTETKQNASPISLGTGYQEPNTGLIAGAALPSSSTAVLADITPDTQHKLMPGTITVS